MSKFRKSAWSYELRRDQTTEVVAFLLFFKLSIKIGDI